MQRVFKAVPLSDFGRPIADVTVTATSVLDALQQARQALGPETAFDLCEGDRFVLANIPPRRGRSFVWRS